MLFDDFLDDCQSETGSFDCVHFSLDSIETVEYVVEAIFRNADTIVLHVQAEFIGLFQMMDIDFDVSTDWSVLDRVRHQIDNHSFDSILD